MGKRLESVAAPATVSADKHLRKPLENIREGRCEDEA